MISDDSDAETDSRDPPSPSIELFMTNVAEKSKTFKGKGKKREIIVISDSEEPNALEEEEVIETSRSKGPYDLRTFFEKVGYTTGPRKN